MGLDSVELLMDVEDHFEITITDSEAEKIVTVNDFVECVYQKVEIKPSNRCLSQIIFYRLKTCFLKKNIPKENIHPSKKMITFLDQNSIKEDWSQLSKETRFKLPELVRLDHDQHASENVKFMGIKVYGRKKPLTQSTLKNLVDWVIALNYKELVNIHEISNRYELERMMIGLISENIGIPVNEISLNHAIVEDLGVD